MPRIKRRKPAADRKEDIIKVCVSAAQRKTMEAAAAREGVGVSTWLRIVGIRAAQLPPVEGQRP